MDIKVTGENIYVVLSERNVRQLLEAHNKGYSAGLCRRTESDHNLYIRVESDTEHYKDRPAGPGLDRKLNAPLVLHKLDDEKVN